jgi:hypothetical protein
MFIRMEDAWQCSDVNVQGLESGRDFLPEYSSTLAWELSNFWVMRGPWTSWWNAPSHLSLLLDLQCHLQFTSSSIENESLCSRLVGGVRSGIILVRKGCSGERCSECDIVGLSVNFVAKDFSFSIQKGIPQITLQLDSSAYCIPLIIFGLV